MSWICVSMVSCWSAHKKRSKYNNEMNHNLDKYKIKIEQFYVIKRMFLQDNTNKNDDDDDESTFNNLAYVSKLGIKVDNENFWPVMRYIIREQNCKKVIPIQDTTDIQST
jgi:hypothetical protein